MPNKGTRIKTSFHPANTDIKIIETVLQRNRNVKVFAGLSLITLSCLFVVFLPIGILSYKVLFVLSIGFMLTAFAGIYCLLNAFLRYDAQKNHFLKLMTRHPEDVVWIYYKKVETYPFGINFLQFTTLYIHLVNHEKIVLQMGENRIHQLMNLLRYRLPTATFGYSSLKKQLYNISPDLLNK